MIKIRLALSLGNYSKSLILLTVWMLVSTTAMAVDVSWNEKDGLFQVKNKSSTFIKAHYVGWAENWKWDGPLVSFSSVNHGRKVLHLNFRNQGVKSKVVVERHQRNVEYVYQHELNNLLPSHIGGGIEFNLDLQSQTLSYGGKDPKLLPDNEGWAWEFEPGKTIEVNFPPNIAKIHFERGNKSRIRVMFFGADNKVEREKISMSLTVPVGSSIASLAEMNSEKQQHSSWLHKSLDPIKSFVDLSSLNEKPAGNHGFVKVVNEELKFADGSPARFFGTNVQAYSLFIKNKEKVKKHAKRLAQLGFNLVRLHHGDSIWLKHSLIKQGSTTQTINEAALDSYFWWVKCLRDEGIYVWIDLQVQRPWRKGDIIPGWETDIALKAKRGMTVAKGFIYLNKRMQKLTERFNKGLLTRLNPYTQLALKDDPAVMGMMITNENDITGHYGNNFLANKGHPYHQNLFDKLAKEYSEKHSLSYSDVRKTWVPGSSKYLLNDIEARFHKKMITYLRDDLDVKVPITTTSLWGRNSALFSLPALTVGDMVDAHGYAEKGIFNKSQLQKNPHYEPNFLHLIGQGQAVGKPFTVTEYNAEDGADLDDAYIPAISVASMAAFQSWDAIMLYGYSQDALKGGRASSWSSYTHPTIMGVMPAMALLYREMHVAPAKKTIVLAPANDELFGKELSPKTSAAIRTTLEQHRMLVAMPKTRKLPWLSPSKIDKNAVIIHDLNKSMLPVSKKYIVSDTGEIKRDWRKGVMTINSPKSQLAMGKIGGLTIKLDDIIVKAKTPEAAIIFTSLDKKSIQNSKRILVSAVAKAAKIKRRRMTSYISEPVIAEITFTSIHRGLRMRALQPDGTEGKSLSLVRNSSGKYSFELSEKDKTHWYVITL